jgi:hypothetical protein
MKFTKLSLVAALAVSAAVAGGDIAPVEPAAKAPVVKDECNGCGKISGDFRLYYGTNDAGGADLFSKNGAYGDAAFRLDYTRDVLDGAVTLNAGIQGVSTLGLENELVSNTWISHGADGEVLDDALWIDILNAQIKLGNTAIIAGRQAIDTPFLFTETWSIAKNTFDAVVLANSDLPETTVVAAWVGRGNGINPADGARVGAAATVYADATSIEGGMHDFLGNPAYAVGAVTKLIPNTVAQAWYYRVQGLADAYWLQADVNYNGLTFGAQYAGTSNDVGLDDTDAFAVKVGYAKDALNAYVAYSQASDDNGIAIQNLATSTGQSKLYTEAYWSYGYVGSRDAETIAVAANYDLGMATIGAQYTTVDAAGDHDVDEIALTASTKLGPVDVDLAYVNTDFGDADKENEILIMTKVPFDL